MYSVQQTRQTNQIEHRVILPTVAVFAKQGGMGKMPGSMGVGGKEGMPDGMGGVLGPNGKRVEDMTMNEILEAHSNKDPDDYIKDAYKDEV